MTAPLPLADAARRLSRRGRPPLSDDERERRSARRVALQAAKLAAVRPRLLDVASAAKYLGVGMGTVRGLIDAGTLTPVRIPIDQTRDLRAVRLDRDDLDALIQRWKA